MSLVPMLRRSASMTLLVYAAHTLTATLLTWPLGRELAAALARAPRSSAQEAAATLEVAARIGPRLLLPGLLCGLVYILLSPLLTLAWLDSMKRSDAAPRLLQRALAPYPPALALGAIALGAYAATLSCAALALAYGPGFLAASTHVEELWLGCCLAGAALGTLAIATTLDLARAALASGTRGAAAALRAALRALRLQQLAAHALIVAAVAACLIGAEAIARFVPGDAALIIALVPEQALVFLATALRAAWLAFALSSITRR